MVSVEGLDIDPALKEKGAEWVMEQGEAFWVSMGFPELPQTFWDKSSLYPLPEDADYKRITMPLPGIWTCRMMCGRS